MEQKNRVTMEEISQIIIETSQKQRKDFWEENLILELCCENPDDHPRVIAETYNMLVKDANKNGNDIIRVFRKCKLEKISERISLIRKSKRNAQYVLEAIEKNDPEPLSIVQTDLDTHIQSRRLLLLSLAIAWKSNLSNEAYQYLLRMNRDFSNECIDTILDLITERGGGIKRQDQDRGQDSEACEAYREEIYRLNTALNRANNLVTRLQESFEEQMIEMRAEEEMRMISMLNSEKYGYILDLLISAQSGFRQLRKKGPIPFEIKSVQSLVRRLLEFVEDCDIIQMFEIGEQLSVKASELDGYSYNGQPFADSDEVKQVEVISPGWKLREKDLVISYPRVKEIVVEKESKPEKEAEKEKKKETVKGV